MNGKQFICNDNTYLVMYELDDENVMTHNLDTRNDCVMSTLSVQDRIEKYENKAITHSL